VPDRLLQTRGRQRGAQRAADGGQVPNLSFPRAGNADVKIDFFPPTDSAFLCVRMQVELGCANILFILGAFSLSCGFLLI
jgi:hypothetical protein